MHNEFCLQEIENVDNKDKTEDSLFNLLAYGQSAGLFSKNQFFYWYNFCISLENHNFLFSYKN